jgi:hypothetical protein
MRSAEGWWSVRYIAGFTIGLAIFVLFPETVRWFHGGAIAQEAVASIFGNKISGHADYSGVGSPDQTGPVTGGETNVTVCPDRDGRYPSAVGTYVGPGSSMTATASNAGGTAPLQATDRL